MTGSRHVASLTGKPPDVSRDGSTLTSVTSADVPLLDGLSIRRMIIAPTVVREPHWHTNAAELGYCLAGQALVTIFADANVYEQFTVTAGQLYYVPSGALHTIENTGPTACEIIAAFTHEAPQEFGMRARWPCSATRSSGTPCTSRQTPCATARTTSLTTSSRRSPVRPRSVPRTSDRRRTSSTSKRSPRPSGPRREPPSSRGRSSGRS
jgi:oxalate decarboxylase